MPRDWKALADVPGSLYVESDFKNAMYQLVVQQCLYLRQRDHAVAYRLISANREAYEEAVALMGLRLGFNERYEFCCVTQDGGAQAPIDLQETLFLLTLRQLYHVRATGGDLTADGDAVVGIAEFEESYKALCLRDFDARADSLRALLKAASRHGLARAVDAPEGDPQPFAIAILPGIVEVLSEYALNRFGADLKARLISTEPTALPPEAVVS